MMIDFKQLFFLITSLMFTSAMAAQPMWEPLATANRSIANSLSTVKTENRRLYKLDRVQLKQKLARSGYEGRAVAGSEIELPLKDGQLQRFSLEQSPILAPELAAKYPNIKTYKIHGLDDPIASGRLSMTSKGFHGMVTNAKGTFYIDPEGNDVYSSYDRRNSQPDTAFKCNNPEHTHASPLGIAAKYTAQRTAGSLQVYRLAVAGTAEYVNAVGPSQSQAYDEVVVAINRVNEIFERDLGIRLNLVSDENILYTDSATDPYLNPANNEQMLDENQANLDSSGFNYDVGHVFSTFPGGLALVGSVCGSSKAQGVTGLLNPVGDPFYIDFVAHEIGHQFGADHSFNGSTSGCSNGTREAATSFEPGSGSTIMAYAGICGVENIQNRSDAVFHIGSINQIDSFTSSSAGGCSTASLIANPSEPTVEAGSNFTIPRKTPFVLNANADDADGDTISYSWDQIDAGNATNSSTFGFDLTNNSLFRSYLPRADSYRHFPSLDTTMRNKFDGSEVLPCKSRDVNFRLTVRDGKSGMTQDDVVITSDNQSGPFEITSFNSSQSLSPGFHTIQWDVANTNRAPVNCAQVDVSLLTFDSGKTTYSETLLESSIPNNGSSLISIPDNSSSLARLKVQCSDNVFYDISDEDLTITGSTPFATTGFNVYRNSNGLVSFDAPYEICETEATNDSSGGGAFSLAWLLSLFFLSLFIPARIRT